MNNEKFQKHLENIKRGDPEKVKRFEDSVKILASDPKIAKMSEDTQNKILDKLASKYKSKEAESTKQTASATKANVTGSPEGTEGNGLTSGLIGSGGGTDYGSYGEGLVSSVISSLGGDIAKRAGMAGAASVLGGIPIADAIKGAVLNPKVLGTMGISAVGNAVVDTLGFTKSSGLLETLGQTGLSLALTAINPALGIAAQVLGRPVVQLAIDYMDKRTLESDLDTIEETVGKIKGMQLTQDAMNTLNKAGLSSKDIVEQVTSGKYNEYNKAVQALQKDPENKSLQKTVGALQKQVGALADVMNIKAAAVPELAASAYALKNPSAVVNATNPEETLTKALQGQLPATTTETQTKGYGRATDTIVGDGWSIDASGNISITGKGMAAATARKQAMEVKDALNTGHPESTMGFTQDEAGKWSFSIDQYNKDKVSGMSGTDQQRFAKSMGMSQKELDALNSQIDKTTERAMRQSFGGGEGSWGGSSGGITSGYSGSWGGGMSDTYGSSESMYA